MAIRHLISLDDLDDAGLCSLAVRGAAFADQAARDSATSAGAATLAGSRSRSPTGAARPLAGTVAGMYFRKTSTRTRTAFSAAALRLGGQIIAFGPHDLQLVTGETSPDTGGVLAGMLDFLVARTAGDPAELRDWAAQERMAVVNAMTADEHPTQALADLTTLLRQFGRLSGLRVLYIGEGNNTAAALALSLSRFPGTVLELRTPPGYGLATAVMARVQVAAARSKAQVSELHQMRDRPAGFDVIYTSRWQTTGTTKADPQWRRAFRPFQVTADLWVDNPRAVFMHDLPAHREDEVTAEVLDGPHSIAFSQAANKMYSAMAVLEWCRYGAVPDAVNDMETVGLTR
jgi:ornithine carbamoyltransferase